MSNKSNNRNQNAPSYRPSSPQNKNGKITPEKATFFESVAGAWVIILGIVCSVFFSDHDVFSKYILLGAIICTILYGLHVHYRHKIRNNSSLSIWLAITTISINSAAIASISTHEFYLRIPTLERFHFSAGTSIQSNSILSSRTPFLSVVSTPGRLINRPIQLLLSTTIANVQPSKVHILAYSLEVSRAGDGPWAPLCPVDVRGHTLVWAYDPAHAIVISTDNFLDNLLLNKTIESGQVVSGWSAWECPAGCNFGFYRMTIRDASGVRTARIIQQPRKMNFEESVGSGLNVTGQHIDVSSAKIAAEPFCHL